MNRDITISELPATTVADDNSYIPIDNGDITYRIKVSDYNAGANGTARTYAESASNYANAAAESASSAAASLESCLRQEELADDNARAAYNFANNAQTHANTAYEYAAAASTSASNATSQAQQVSDYAREAGEKSEDAEAFAVGQRKGVDVTSEDVTFENNAKYYKEQASAEVARISDLTANVSNEALKAEGYAVGTQNGLPEISEYSQNNAKYYAENAAASANDARFSKNTAIMYANKAESAVVKAPYIGDNNHWYVYNFDQEEYVDTNVGATGAPGQQGDPGTNGITPTITATASVDNTSGTPSVTVQKSGSNTNPSFAFSFSGLKGEPGTSYDDTEIKSEINDIWKAQGELGAKNLLVYPYTDGEHKTLNGIEYTDNDGVITVNGTASGTSSYVLAKKLQLKVGKYKIADFCQRNRSVYFNIDVENASGGYVSNIIRVTDGLIHEFEITSEQISINAENGYSFIVQLYIINNGATIDNFVFYPMIWYAEDTDNTWQPYVPTNKELAIKINDAINLISNTPQEGSSSSKWDGKNVLFIGDSLTATLKYQKTVKNNLGINVYNHCKGGMGIVQCVDGENGAPPYDPNSYNASTLYALRASDVENMDLIVFYAGYNNRGTADGNVGDCYDPNDSTQGRTIAGYMQYAINRIYEELVNANNLTCKLLIVTVDCAGKCPYIDADGYEQFPSGSGQTMETLANIQKAVAEANNIPCLDLWHNSGINRHTWTVYGANPNAYIENPSSTSTPYPHNGDQLHKSDAGYKLIGDCITGAIIRNWGVG